MFIKRLSPQKTVEGILSDLRKTIQQLEEVSERCEVRQQDNHELILRLQNSNRELSEEQSRADRVASKIQELID